MKKTLGEYLGFEADEYPITLNFNDFYYYENGDHNHILLHTPTKRKSTEFYILSTDHNIIKKFNTIFDLQLTEIHIHDPISNEMLCHSTPNSDFLYVKGSSYGTATGSRVYQGMISINIDMLWDTSTMTDDEKAAKETQLKFYFHNLNLETVDMDAIETEQDVSETDQARPPT